MSIHVLPLADPPEPLMWHVTLTVAGDPVSSESIQAALERLSEQHPFLLAGRFAIDRAEVRYWEQADDADTAVSLALHLWNEHLDSAGLPPGRSSVSRSSIVRPFIDAAGGSQSARA